MALVFCPACDDLLEVVGELTPNHNLRCDDCAIPLELCDPLLQAAITQLQPLLRRYRAEH